MRVFPKTNAVFFDNNSTANTHVCLCVAPPRGLPYTPGLPVVSWGRVHPCVHVALGPLEFFSMWGGRSPLLLTQTHGLLLFNPDNKI